MARRVRPPAPVAHGACTFGRGRTEAGARPPGGPEHWRSDDAVGRLSAPQGPSAGGAAGTCEGCDRLPCGVTGHTPGDRVAGRLQVPIAGTPCPFRSLVCRPEKPGGGGTADPACGGLTPSPETASARPEVPAHPGLRRSPPARCRCQAPRAGSRAVARTGARSGSKAAPPGSGSRP